MTRSQSDRERQLVERAHAVLPGGNLGNVAKDIVIERGQGSHIWDASGNEYIDYLLGSGPMLIGHSHPEVLEVVREQLANGTTFFANNEFAIELAEEIVRCGALRRQSQIQLHGNRGDSIRDAGSEGLQAQGQDTEVRGRIPRDERLLSHEHLAFQVRGISKIRPRVRPVSRSLSRTRCSSRHSTISILRAG